MNAASEGNLAEESALMERPFSLSPRAPVTPTLIGLNVAILVGLWAEGGAIAETAPVERLIAWGGNFGPLTLSGEWWRLLACAFLHSSLTHFASNMIGLWFGGNLLERRIGSPAFLGVYIASAVLGSLASLSARPDLVGHGASAAVLGVYGALFCASLGRPRPTEQRLWNSDLFLSSFLIGLTLGRGYLDNTIDNPGHMGGLATGAVFGVALRSAHSATSRLWATAAASLATLAVLFAIGSYLPRRVVVIDAELRRYTATSNFLLNRFDAARTSKDGDGLPVGEFRKFLEFEILPLARTSRLRLENLGDAPGNYGKHLKRLIEDGRFREREWELLMEEFGLLERTLDRLYELEQGISVAYSDVQREIEERSLSRSQAAVQIFDEAVDPWDSLISDLSSSTGLRRAVQGRIDVLREYAEIRRRAWSLYAESVRERDSDRAATANEEHRRANELFQSWTD